MTQLQVAIDRVSLERASALVSELAPVCDIIEIGTSLTKEFGMRALSALCEARNKAVQGEAVQGKAADTHSGSCAKCSSESKHTGAALLADIKTCDEGAYEFNLGYECGYDILTVIGSSSSGTLHACAQSAREHGKRMMIDLLECNAERVAALAHDEQLHHAIFCLHSSVDDGGSAHPVHDVEAFKQAYPWIEHVAIAGGIKQESLPGLAQAGTDIVIMGSAIVKAQNVAQAAQQAMDALQ